MRKWLPLITVSLGTFMLLIDVTIVNVALPDMAVDLHSSFSALQWVIDIYALGLAALLLGIGSLADLFGRKPVYVGGLVLFAVSSTTAGLSSGTAMLITARAFQGVGAAAMLATTIALLNSSYQGRDRGTAFGIWGATNGAAAAAGPIIGGLLTQGLSWRWIFFVNIPISVLAVALSLRVLPSEERRTDTRIDYPGILAFTTAAAAVTFALTRASENGWGSATTLGLFGLAAVAAVAFVITEARRRQPMIEISLLKRGRFSGVLFGSLMLSAAAFSYLTYSSLWMQSVRHMSPIATGLALVPLSLASLVVSASVGRFLPGLAPRWVIGGGLALIGLGALAQAHLNAGSTSLSMLPGLIIGGIGVGLAVPTLASAALGAVPVHRGGMASGAVNTGRQLGYALGVAGLGVICQTRIEHHLRGVIPHPGTAARLLIGGQGRILTAAAPPDRRAALDHAVHASFASGLNLTLVVSGVLGLVGAAVVAVTVRGQALAPHPSPGQTPNAPPVAADA